MKIAVALVHALFATIWLGSAFFYTALLLPRLRLQDDAMRQLRAWLRRTMTPLLAASAVVTIVSGFVLMVQQHSAHPGPLSQSRWGVSLVVGTLSSLAALAIAVVVESMARRAARAEGGGRTSAAAPAHEMPLRLAALGFLFLALLTMVVARYS